MKSIQHLSSGDDLSIDIVMTRKKEYNAPDFMTVLEQQPHVADLRLPIFLTASKPLSIPGQELEFKRRSPKHSGPSPYDPSDTFQLLEQMHAFGLYPADYESFIIPTIEFLHEQKKLWREKKLDDHTLSRVAITFGLFKNINWDTELSRRSFLSIACAASAAGLLLSACGTTSSNRSFGECKPVLPPVSPDSPTPISQVEYDAKNINEKAFFLRQGGIVTEWDTTNADTFFQQASQAVHGALIPSFANLMEEDMADLSSRIYVPESKSDFIELLTDLSGPFKYNLKDADETADENYGISTYDRTTGQQVIAINLEKLKEDYLKDFDEKRYGIIVLAIAELYTHELSHLTNTPDDLTDDEKSALKAGIEETQPDRNIDTIQDPFMGLEIDYLTPDQAPDTYRAILVNSAGDNSEDGIFGEILREYIQQGFNTRLDKVLNLQEKTPYSSYYSDYVGFSLLTYFHEKIGANDDGTLSFYNSFRKTGEDRKLGNMANLINFYKSKAASVGLNVTDGQIILALRYVEAEARLSQTTTNEFIDQNKDDFTEYVCQLYDYLQAGKNLIDKILEKPIAPSSTLFEKGFTSVVKKKDSVQFVV